MSLQELVNAANAAALDAKYHYAKAEALKAAAIGEAERLRSTGTPIRELISDQGLGALRLDGSNLPAVPRVDKPEEVTSWLAERAPHLVRAVVSVPVDALGDALDALGYAGIATATARAELRDPDDAARWVNEHCKIQADPDHAGAWNVLYVDEDGHTTPIPGMSATRPVPTWKLLANLDLQARNREIAQSEVDELVRQLREAAAAPALTGAQAVARTVEYLAQPDPDVSPAELAADLADAADEDGYDGPMPGPIARGPSERMAALGRGVDAALAKRAQYAALRRPELAALCEERGLPNVGTKDELMNRLLTSDGLLAPDVPDAAHA